MKFAVSAAAAGVAGSLALAGFALAAPTPADTVFVNGKVFTADPKGAVAQGFAVRGERFVAVGSSAAMRTYVGPSTQVVDLRGRFVMPGLTDNHFHNEGGGTGVDLSQVRSLPELLAVIGDAVAAAPPGGLIVTNSDWHEAQLTEQRLPLATELDMVSPNNPVVVVRGGHSYILNSAALKRWNISTATPVPAGGAISRDDKGALTGELFDNAKALVDLPPDQPVSMADILESQKVMNAYGVTAVRVPGSYRGDTVAAYRLMKQAEAAGDLTLRWTVYMPGFGVRDPAQVASTVERWGVKLDEGSDWVRVGGVKLIVDGGFEGGHMTTPYLEPYGKGGTYDGVTVVPPGPYTAVVREFNRLGWRVTTHAVGDAGIDEVLDAYEAAAGDGTLAGGRWAIEHAFVSRPDQVERMKRLGIYVSAQDHLYLAAPVLKKYWGWERASEVTPVKTYVDAGLETSIGTDSPVIPVNPFWNLYHFLSRDTISDGVYGADQRFSDRAQLLDLITINYARLIGEDYAKGSIEPGKLADFAVVDHDLLTTPAEGVRDAKALATYVGGKQVYRDPSF